MFARLAALFIVIPLVELWILVQVGERVGALPTLLLVVGTGLLGAELARRQGLLTLLRFREALAGGRLPHREIVEGLLVLLAGALLLTPGLLTDATGFLLLVPAVRRRVAARLGESLRRRVFVATPGAGRAAGGGGPWAAPRSPSPPADVVDADYTVVEEGTDRAPEPDRVE